ncbi:MAG: HD domain-containing protein [Puniceicoccales bacterium]|nr:HD domain-containing protein [Puniceicoccales bacterium]
MFDVVLWICNELIGAGARPYLVGGCVRDAILGAALTDFDVEVFSMPFGEVEKILSKKFTIEKTGKAFCVLKLREFPIDVSVPRLEVKSGSGHRDFSVDQLGECNVKIAAERRDFTINATYFDVKGEKIIDAFDGIGDMASRTLRHVGEKFSEDPLRVLRGMQLAGRFNLVADRETIALCRGLSIRSISSERIFFEWKKLILQAETPSLGLKFLEDSGWLKFFPEIGALAQCMQDSDAHPEGSVFVHTCMALDAFAKARIGDELEDLILGFATLCHDFGKPYVTTHDSRGIHHYDHDKAGVEPATQFLQSINAPKYLIEAVSPLILWHMVPRFLYGKSRSDGDVLRLANRVGRIDRLLRLCFADFAGRANWRERYDPGMEEWLGSTARRLGVFSSKPAPLIQGRHLVEFGVAPSEKFSRILDECFEAQLNCEFVDLSSGLAYLQKAMRCYD